MCQGKDPTPAVEFATNNLAPRAANNLKFLKKLEQTMALIIFPHNSLQPELAALLSPDLRRTVAYKVNMAMLRRRSTWRCCAVGPPRTRSHLCCG
jgi:Ran binding protein in the microtubule-organising centre.